ncbi:hypothetical protein MMPV_007449 [Pyropia vietnamensis]
MARSRAAFLASAAAVAAAVLAAALSAPPATHAVVVPRSPTAGAPPPSALWSPPATPVRVAEADEQRMADGATASLERDDGDDVYLPAPTSRGWLSRNLKSIRQKLRKAGNAVSKGFKQAVRAVSKGVRDAGRAVNKAVSDAGKAVAKAGADVAKFTRRRVGDISRGVDKAIAAINNAVFGARDALNCVVNRRRCRSRRSRTGRGRVDDATVVANGEAAGKKALARLTTAVNDEIERVKEAVEGVESVGTSLDDLLGSLRTPLSGSQRELLESSVKHTAEALLEGQATLTGVRKFVEAVQKAVQTLVDAATAAPGSASLKHTAADAEVLLAELVAAEEGLAEAVEATAQALDRATALQSK